MRQDISFATRDGTRLGGWLYLPSGAPPFPCIVMSHGFTAVIDQGLPPFAEAYAHAGYACLVYDHRGYGRSAGTPRSETNPFLQMQDMRDAVTFAGTVAQIDEDQIVIWGTSYSGGHALVVGAVDRRVRAVIAIVPLTSGSQVIARSLDPKLLKERLQRAAHARRQEMETGATVYQVHATAPESLGWFERSNSSNTWENRVSTVSHDMVMEYEPVAYIDRIAPTPLLMIITDSDRRSLTELQIEAFERAQEPKKLISLPGGHYDVYESLRDTVAAASIDWLNSIFRQR